MIIADLVRVHYPRGHRQWWLIAAMLGLGGWAVRAAAGTVLLCAALALVGKEVVNDLAAHEHSRAVLLGLVAPTTLADESWQNLQLADGEQLAGASSPSQQQQISPQQQLAQYLQQSAAAAPYQTQQLPLLQTTVQQSSPCGTTTTVTTQPLCGSSAPCASPCEAAAPAPSAAPWYYPVRSNANSGLMPGAEQYYYPQVQPGDGIAATTEGGIQNLLQRMSREMTTDTMEIANLDNQIAVDQANNRFLAEKYEDLVTLRTRAGPPGPPGPQGKSV
jgi:hypothetical protein